MKAEIYRNLGQFEESKRLLDRISNVDLIQVKEKLLNEINKKNKQVFQLFWECGPSLILHILSPIHDELNCRLLNINYNLTRSSGFTYPPKPATNKYLLLAW